MPVSPSYPGIYIEELPLSAHAISAAPTSIAAFIGYSHPYKTRAFRTAVRIFSFSDFEREFGGMFASGIVDTRLAHAVNQFFLNGGSDAWVVGLEPRLYAADGTVAGSFTGAGAVVYTADVVTDAGNGIRLTGEVLGDVVPLRAVVTNIRASEAGVADSVFDLILTHGTTIETYRGLDLAGTGDNDPLVIVNANSNLVSAAVNGAGVGATLPAAAATLTFTATLPAAFADTFSGADYNAQMAADSSLDKVEIFNLLVLPGVNDNNVVSTGLSFAERKRAFMIVDPPFAASSDGGSGMTAITDLMPAIPRSQNGAIYFPWLMSTDPVRGVVEPMPPSGFVAGVYARTDSQRGVWKAPAGIAANVLNTTGPFIQGRMNDMRAGVLNKASVNALRAFAAEGTVVFGARTLVADNTAYPQSKYIPVRRMTLFIEQTLLANLRWVVFEPNDIALWTAIRTTISSFMLSLFNQGALGGSKPSEAFRVACDATTTTADDQANGIVNIVVAFKPLKPAEFVVIKIAQLAGQSA
ncbi:MAG: phage tail sheath family protein [Alphaproteobacteria bacterium]|nr:MAG: phage tail sheath family protein [Alphaproteobacteria bacterium]